MTSLYGFQGLDLSQVRFLQALGPVMAGVQEMEGMIEGAIGSFMSERGGEKVVVIMDGMDFMMATLEVGAGEMLEMVGKIREVGVSTFSLFLRRIFASFSID